MAMLGTALAVLGCGNGSSASLHGHNAAIVVDGRSISPATIVHLTRIFAGGHLPRAGSARAVALKVKACEYVIVSTWLVAEASRRKIAFPAERVQAALERDREAEFPGGRTEQTAFMSQTGEKAADVEQRAIAEVATAVLRERVLRSASKVTESEVRGYYEHHLRQYLTPERREIWLTNRKTAADAERVRRQVAAGASFRDLAERNLQPLRPLQRGERRGALEAAIFDAPKHRLVGPVFQPVDYYLFEVARIVPGSTQTLPQVEAGIRHRLTAMTRRRALVHLAHVIVSRWSPATRCSSGYVVPGCREYRGGRAVSIGLFSG